MIAKQLVRGPISRMGIVVVVTTPTTTYVDATSWVFDGSTGLFREEFTANDELVVVDPPPVNPFDVGRQLIYDFWRRP